MDIFELGLLSRILYITSFGERQCCRYWMHVYWILICRHEDYDYWKGLMIMLLWILVIMHHRQV